MESSSHPVMRAALAAGGQRHLADALGVTPSMVWQWATGHRPVAADKCAAIERATQGAHTVEALRPDVAWARIPDPTWPHPAGRPVIDVARPAPTAAAVEAVA